MSKEQTWSRSVCKNKGKRKWLLGGIWEVRMTYYNLKRVKGIVLASVKLSAKN